MGSFLGASAATDSSLYEPDKTTGLSPYQKQILKDTWGLVKPKMKETGVVLFLKLFIQFPSYQQHFESFANVPMEDLPTNKKLAAHASTVMYALSSVIDNLDDPDCVVELLLKIGFNHGRRGLTFEHFKNAGIVIMDLLEEKLGEIMTKDTKEAWLKAVDVITSVVALGIDEVKKTDTKEIN